jgi:hypothetical protein
MTSPESSPCNVIPASELHRRREAKAVAKRALSTIAASGAQPPPVCPCCGRMWIGRPA